MAAMGKPAIRDAAVVLTDALTAPPSIMHYETGALVYRQFLRYGRPWLAMYESEHDGTGWLVVRSSCRPLVLLPGDAVHFRGIVEEDHGDTVMVRLDAPSGRATRAIPRSLIVYIEERGGVSADSR